MTRDVFISYASADEKTADEVCAALEASGISCWIAPRNVKPGVDYAASIVDAIRDARVLLLILSQAANASRHIKRELDRAVAGGLAILPVRVEDVAAAGPYEYYLAGAQWFEASRTPISEQLEVLCGAVSDLLGVDPVVTPGGNTEAAPPARQTPPKASGRAVMDVTGHTTHFEPGGGTQPAPTGVPKTRWAKTIDGVWIAYQDFGEGPQTLVFMNGLYSHLEVYWELHQFASFMNRLAAGTRVLHFDRRGTGLSDRISYTPTLEARMDDIRAVMDAARVERAALYGWGWGAPALAALFAATYPERTSALLLDGWLALRWAPDYPCGMPSEEMDAWLSRLVEIWGDEDHALEIGQLTCGNRPEDGPWDDPEFVRWHARLARFSATPGSFEAFEREEYETDVRDIARQVHVPTAIFEKKGDFEEEVEIAKYNASLIPGARLIWVDGAADVVMFDEIEAYTDAMIDFLRSVEDEQHALDSVLATVLFTDVSGSMDMSAQMGDAAWTKLLERLNVTARAMLARYRGNEVKTVGNGFLATFDGPARAVKCAQAICEAVKPLGLEVKAGCHTGEIELAGDDVRGTAVEVGARVCALAGPSQVLVSSTVKDLVAGSGLSFADRGEHKLEGLEGVCRLYEAT